MPGTYFQANTPETQVLLLVSEANENVTVSRSLWEGLDHGHLFCLDF